MSPDRQALSTDPVRRFLREIGRVARLTPEEELTLARHVQDHERLLVLRPADAGDQNEEAVQDRWAEAAGISPAALRLALHRGRRAKERMIQANLRLVVAVARKYQQRGLDLLDLVQEGSLGLERGVERFDPTRGFRFSTYAYWWIRQGITRALASQSRTIRLPVHINEKLRRIRQQKQWSLSDVENRSDSEFKASVLGAYERGERAISVPRLMRLAEVYDVPADSLLPREVDVEIDLTEGEGTPAGFTIDLTQLNAIEDPEAAVLARYAATIQLQRQDFNGRLLTIRRDDMRVLAAVLGRSTDDLPSRLDELGLRANA